MRSFLREMEEKFVELENHCETCDKPSDQCVCEELDEVSATGAVAGYNTPAAFRKTVKHVDYATGIEESKLKVEDVLERKYEQLIEGYRTFSTADSKTSPEQKVKNTIKEVAKKLQEIETMVNYNSRLKTESGVTSDAYGNSTKKALAKISERLVKISERVRALGE
jgi:hypothetical protein